MILFRNFPFSTRFQVLKGVILFQKVPFSDLYWQTYWLSLVDQAHYYSLIAFLCRKLQRMDWPSLAAPGISLFRKARRMRRKEGRRSVFSSVPFVRADTKVKGGGGQPAPQGVIWAVSQGVIWAVCVYYTLQTLKTSDPGRVNGEGE